jgi:hypothetical protein
VQAYERSIIEEIVRNYDVDGIVLDWLRFDNHNMDVGGQTRAKFKAAFGYDPTDIDFKTDNPQRAQWNAWRTAQIARLHRKRSAGGRWHKARPQAWHLHSAPGIVEVGQDAGQFSQHVSFLAPMVYFDDWGYPELGVHQRYAADEGDGGRWRGQAALRLPRRFQ